MDVRIVGISTNDELNVDISRISTYSSLDVNVSQKSFSTLDVRVTNTPDVSIKNSYIYTKDY
jgi:hypothetical protein